MMALSGRRAWAGAGARGRALPACVHKEGGCPQGSTKSRTICPGLLRVFKNAAAMKGRLCLAVSLGRKVLLSLCPNTYRIVPLNGSVYSQIPTESWRGGGRLQRNGCPPGAQCPVVTRRGAWERALARRLTSLRPLLGLDANF